MSIFVKPEPWMVRGRCQAEHTDTFFEEEHEERAKTICSACPAKNPCLDYALRHRIDHGVWGGLSPNERDRYRRRKRRQERERVA